jgi:hypothetical protein
LGLSVVKFKSIDYSSTKIVLMVEGVDLVSGTPILDIKPYIAYADSYPEATSGPFQQGPGFRKVVWKVEPEINLETKLLIEKVIGLDPRSGADQMDSFGVSIAGYNVRFQMTDDEFVILELTKE